MPTVAVYTMKGQVVGDLELSDAVFGVAAKPAVVASVIEALRANLRRPTAHTKSRGEVAGGGKKPWKQKGTGRARVGSIRSPLWRGGGIIFGPKSDRNYGKKVNAKLRSAALRMCLSEKAANGALALVETVDVADGKTKGAALLMRALTTATSKPFDRKPILFLLERENEAARRAMKNLPTVTAVGANELNALRVLTHPLLAATLAGIKELEEQLRGKRGTRGDVM